MKRKCNYCDRLYEAIRPTSKYCSSNCRARYSQTGGPVRPDPVPSRPKTSTSATISPDQDPIPAVLDNSLVIATRAELEAAGVVDTMMGQQALRIAQQMSGFETAGGMASLSKELSRVMAEALRASVSSVVDPVDELRMRREAKRVG